MAGTTTSLRISLVAQTNGQRIDIGKVHALVCKFLQGDIPLDPIVNQHCFQVIVSDHRAAIESNIHRFNCITCIAIVEQRQCDNIILSPVSIQRPGHLRKPCTVVVEQRHGLLAAANNCCLHVMLSDTKNRIRIT